MDMHPAQGKLVAIRNCGHLVITWCKRKRRTIFICAGAMLLVAAGVAAHKRFSTPPALCSFPSTISTPPALCSFPSTISIPSSIPEDQTPIIEHANQRNNSGASTSTELSENKALITDLDRLQLEECLQSVEKGHWVEIVNKQVSTLEHRLFERHPKTGGPMQYLSTTRYRYYQNPTQIKNFMTDNDYKLEHDKMLKSFKTLDIDTKTGIEVWHAIKEYPYIGYREYVLATKMWEREEDKSYFCVTKACSTHPKAPKPKHTLITNYLSGWKISKAAKGGCEVKVFHQEDIKSAVADFVKENFKNVLVNYVLETEKNLQEYIRQNRQPKEGTSAATLAQKIP